GSNPLIPTNVFFAYMFFEPTINQSPTPVCDLTAKWQNGLDEFEMRSFRSPFELSTVSPIQ
ncbi:MAG: hypothetical protein WCQ59_06550, partial [Candidatus Cloacimonadaceae bacterium]